MKPHCIKRSRALTITPFQCLPAPCAVSSSGGDFDHVRGVALCGRVRIAHNRSVVGDLAGPRIQEAKSDSRSSTSRVARVTATGCVRAKSDSNLPRWRRSWPTACSTALRGTDATRCASASCGPNRTRRKKQHRMVASIRDLWSFEFRRQEEYEAP